MPQQKDLKRIVRARMEKTGESYTAARVQVVKKKETPLDYSLAGLAEEKVQNATGRGWAEWVRMLDAFDAAKKPHRDVAAYVSSIGTPPWWSQMVTVGYERIRGLREIGQRPKGTWETTKSRTFPVPVSTLYAAFADAKKRAKWLPLKLKVTTATKDRSVRMTLEDGTSVAVGFLSKGAAKSSVAVQHAKLAKKADIEKVKVFWQERLEALAEELA
jgi:hypothetical protein